LESQAVFSAKIQETFGKITINPQLGETIEFMSDQIVRHLPEKVWLTQDALITDSIEKVRLSSEKPISSLPLQPLPSISRHTKVSATHLSRTQVNKAYVRLRHHLKQLIDEGQRTHNFERVVNLLDSMTRWLEEQERETRR
jgi:metallo-beta-lactamase family protein